MKRLLKILIVIFLILVLAWIILLDPVDYSPYFEANYYKETLARLESAEKEVVSVNGNLQVGFSSLPITPLISQTNTSSTAYEFPALPLAGYGDREGASATGVHDSLYVSAVAIQVGEELRILLTADMLIIPPPISEAVSNVAKQSLGLERGQLFFSATHTHAGAGGWSDRYVGELFAGKRNPRLIQWLSDVFVKAITQSISDLKPGTLAVGSFDADAYIHNRVIGERGREDSEFVFLVLEQFEGQNGLIGSFGAHATTLPAGNMEFSSDYPGYWRASLKKKGYAHPMFFSASVGSHGPEMLGESFEAAQRLGEALADSTWKYAPKATKDSVVELASLTISINLPQFQIRVSEGMIMAPYFSKKLFPPVGKAYVQALRLGSLVWATAPADFSGELAIHHKNDLHKQGYQGLITSFNGAYVGYIIPAKYYHMEQYEARTMSWFGPGMGPYVDEMVRRSMEAVVD